MAAAPVLTSHDGGFINDVQFDFYGRRLATCASDRRIEVFDQGEAGEWASSSWWNAHAGEVNKLAWAHPQFGQVLASCSLDCTVQIWEEQERQGHSHAHGAQTCWHLRATLADSRKEIKDIAFSPSHLGLKIATASMDGSVRIYEAIDVMNLRDWALQDNLEVATSHVSCLAWCSSKFDPPMLVVGAYDMDHSSHVSVWQYGIASRTWESVCELEKHDYQVNDVAWAPNMGRSSHHIASAGQDKKLKVHRLQRAADGLKLSDVSTLRCSNDEEEHEAFRVEWNVTGTVLASSGQDGVVHLWKGNFKGGWQEISAVPSVEIGT